MFSKLSKISRANPFHRAHAHDSSAHAPHEDDITDATDASQPDNTTSTSQPNAPANQTTTPVDTDNTAPDTEVIPTRHPDISPYVRKLSAAPRNYLSRRDSEHDRHQGVTTSPSADAAHNDIANAPTPRRATTYFFYGSLADPSVLASVLDLDAAPALRPAQIVGYKLTDRQTERGVDKALHDGAPDDVVKGSATVLEDIGEDEELETRLEEYCNEGGGLFDSVACRVQFVDGMEEGGACLGRVWRWEDDEDICDEEDEW